METLQINKSNALTAYNNTDAAGKILLSHLLGKEIFNQKITDRVKTYEDACSVLGKEPNDMLPDGVPSDDSASIVAYCKLIIIARALNEGWKPDWTDSSQYKYVPWFKEKSGFGLSYDVYDHWHSYAIVGSRLCFKSRELAEYAATQFAELYRDYLSL